MRTFLLLIILLLAGNAFGQDRFVKKFENSSGAITGAVVYIVHEVTGDSLVLTEDVSNPGRYYRDSVAYGTYKIYVNGVLAETSYPHGVDRQYDFIEAVDPDGDNLIDGGQLEAGSVSTVKIADGAIQSAKIATGAVGSSQISDYGIQSTDIDTGAVTSIAILDGTIDTDDIKPNAIVNSKIASQTIELDNMGANSVNGSIIVNESITHLDIDTGAVRSSEILDGTIVEADLANSAVTSAKIATGNVTTEKLAAEAVTMPKIKENVREAFSAINYVRRNALMKYKASGYYGYHAVGGDNPPAGSWTIDSTALDNPYSKYAIHNENAYAVGQTVYFDGERPDTISVRFAVYPINPLDTDGSDDGIYVYAYDPVGGDGYTTGQPQRTDTWGDTTGLWIFVEYEGIPWGANWDSAYIAVLDFDWPSSDSFYVGAMQVVKGSRLPGEIYSSNLADIRGFSNRGAIAADSDGELYVSTMPVGNLTGAITRDAIDAAAVVTPIHKNALENLTTSNTSTGTPADTLYSLTSDNQTWNFGGRVIRWDPSTDTLINNIAFMKANDVHMDSDHEIVVRRSQTLSADKNTIDGYDSLGVFTMDMDEWNDAGTDVFIYMYGPDININSNYYYYFVWYAPTDTVSARAGTGVDGVADLFWNAGSGNWAAASKDWCAVFRYNNNIQFKLNITVDNVTGLKTSNLDGNLKEWVGGSQADSANPLQLLLPDTMFIPSGYEANIYWDNICLTTDYTDFVFDVTCDSGQSFAQGWRWTPAAGTTGNYTWSVTARNWAWENVGTASMVLSVSNGDTITPIESAMRVLMVGNSITYQNQYTAQVVTNAGSNAAFLGTVNGNSEGWSGKTWTWFESDVNSPFVHSIGGNVDLQTYLTDNSYADPTHITIHLGTNDVFNGTGGIPDILKAADSLIANFKADAPGVKIGICMIIPPSYSQDAAGQQYDNGQTRYGYKRNQHAFNEALKARYGAGGTHYDSDVSLIPVYSWIDTENNMRTTSVALNARNSTTYNRQTDLLHPDSEGGKQMADAIWGWLANKR